MCQTGWDGDLGENGYMYMYGWVFSLSTWNYHNVVNWLYPNTKQKVWKKNYVNTIKHSFTRTHFLFHTSLWLSSFTLIWQLNHASCWGCSEDVTVALWSLSGSMVVWLEYRSGAFLSYLRAMWLQATLLQFLIKTGRHQIHMLVRRVKQGNIYEVLRTVPGTVALLYSCQPYIHAQSMYKSV